MMKGKALLIMEDVSKRYGNGLAEHSVLRNISLELTEGSIVGLLGESGSGKTTIARIITGQEAPDTGSVSLDGERLPPLRKRSKKQAADIQYIFQDPYAALNSGHTVEQVLREPLRLCRRQKRQSHMSAAEALASVGFPDYEAWAGRNIGQLSGGQRQRVAIARALIPRPRLLIADESTSMLDRETAFEVLDVLASINKESGLSVLLITHHLDALRRSCGYVYVLDKGELVERGRVEEVLAEPKSAYARQLVESRNFFEGVETVV